MAVQEGVELIFGSRIKQVALTALDACTNTGTYSSPIGTRRHTGIY